MGSIKRAPASPWVAGSSALVPSLAFFVLVPLLIGILLGATRAGLAAYLPWTSGLAFWVLSSLAVWLCLYAASVAAALALRPWRVPLWAMLATGALFGSMLARYAVYGVAQIFRTQLPPGRSPREAPPIEWTTEFLLGYLQGWTGVYLCWVVIGLIFHRAFAVPRYPTFTSAALAAQPPARGDGLTDTEVTSETAGSAATTATATATADTRVAGEPAIVGSLLARLPAKLGRNVLALEAEDHYVRIHTDLGSTLVLARLSDAITELGPIEGVRVHRSYWVRKGAVTRVFTQGKGLRLKLTNGLEVPVSQAYKELARNFGLAAEPPS